MTLPVFDDQPTLAGPTLTLRPLVDGDFADLYAAARHPAIWAGHPASNRYREDVFRGYFRFLLDHGGTLAVIDGSSGRIIGCSRYYVPPDRPAGMAIGFTFLNDAYWGGPTNGELKRLMLAHAFSCFPEVFFHVAPTNLRSRNAMRKIGATHRYDAVLDLSGSPTPCMCFSVARPA